MSAFFRRTPRTRSFLGHYLPLFVLMPLAAWVSGFLWFASSLPSEVEDPDSMADAIVVLTGGSDRINTGLDLLSRGKGHKLFISGVYKGVEVRELLDLSQSAPKNLECCVVLGYEADDTLGNASETKEWVESQGFGSIRLVTASYHMPRSLLEFHSAMPAIEIIPHPVFSEHVKQKDWWLWPGSTTLIFSEYNKYLVAKLRDWLSALHTGL